MNETSVFQKLDSKNTGITFINKVVDTPEMNIINYRNFYNGAGVAIGDVNNDGLSDIYFTSNQGKNCLYLNQGNMKFKDVTAQAGVAGTKSWSTGVTLADVNADGLMDVYVCNSGEVSGDSRGNELFINQGNKNGVPVFIEKAKEYGLVDGGYSTHAAFFDFDRDGDLDMYLLNNSFIQVNKLQYANLRDQRDPAGGDKLFRNDGGIFKDISVEAGIFGSLIGFGLGITIGDVDNDNWLDIYISNDFYERDYLYINQKNGTFKESASQAFGHTSLSSMGADVADMNNDGNLDVFVTDMLPGDDNRLKRTTTFEGHELEQIKVSRDFNYQYNRNTLQMNNGDGTFSEIAQMAGVSATDWSWGALIFDMDNDGLKDVFVANGIIHDLTDQDFIQFLSDESNVPQMLTNGKLDIKKMTGKMSSEPLQNFVFRNNGNLTFQNKASDWGMNEKTFSNGSAYGDLDNDGDLDLVVNNNNSEAGIFQNNTSLNKEKHYLRVKFKGEKQNLNGIGAKVFIYQNGTKQYQQQMPNRGFQSSSDQTMVFGLGLNPKIDSLVVVWDDAKQVLINLKSDSDLLLNQKDAKLPLFQNKTIDNQRVIDFTMASKINYSHIENDFVDYNRDGLLKQMYSTQGPALAVGDVNADGLEDAYFGGALGQNRTLFIQNTDGTFSESPQRIFELAKVSDETDALFFDADNDKDLDLYVVTGGNEIEPNNIAAIDYLYINDGKGNFSLSSNLPLMLENGSTVAAGDYDKDGDQDLFVGSRMISGQYGRDPKSFVLRNDGGGKFTQRTVNFGMVTDAQWADINGDKFLELITVSDWGSIQILPNKGGKLMAKSEAINHTSGWWNCIKTDDIDNDGDIDLIVGNLGLNTKMKASKGEPAILYANDFDKNGLTESIIACFNNGKCLPMVQKPDLQKVIPMIKKKFVFHKDFAGKDITEIFDEAQRENMTEKKAENPYTSLLINDGNGSFEIIILPSEVQVSQVCGIEVLDYNKDGKKDIFMSGNFYDILPEIGRNDGNYGIVLQGKGNNSFTIKKPQETGFRTNGQVRKMQKIKSIAGKELLILAKNKGNAQVFGFK